MVKEKHKEDKKVAVDHKTSSLFQESKERALAALKKRRKGYVQELKEELKKVDWTSKEELKVYTRIVVYATVIFGLGIYLADLVIKGVMHGIAHLFARVFG